MLCLNRYIPSDIFWIGLSTHILFTISIQRYCYRKYQGYFAKIINIERKKSYCWPLCFNGTVTRVCQWLSETLPIWDTFKRVSGSEPGSILIQFLIKNTLDKQLAHCSCASPMFLPANNFYFIPWWLLLLLWIFRCIMINVIHEASLDRGGGI